MEPVHSAPNQSLPAAGKASNAKPFSNFTTMQCKALFFALFLPLMVNAQNLVPNWSFEEYEECPDGMAQIEKASGWMSFRMSPDFYNSCDLTEVVGVPYNGFTSYKEAIHGNGYAGIAQLTLPAGHREILGIELLESLSAGEEYYISFFVSRGIVPTANCWANKIGIQFVNEAYISWPLEYSIPILNNAHIYASEVISDTLSWTKIEGTFVADSAYSYLAIGNHFDSEFVQMDCDPQLSYSQAYYFIDCVCVSTDPDECSVCDVSTGETQSVDKEPAALIYPNPCTDRLTIEFALGKSGQKIIQLYSMEGKLIFSHKHTEKKIELSNLNVLNKGLYILRIEFENESIKYFKIFKN